MNYARRTLVPAPLEEVFQCCSSVSGFKQQFPFKLKWLHGPDRWRADDVLDFRYRLWGIWIPHVARIVHFKQNECFIDEMTKGLYKHFRHTHSFEPDQTGTWVRDEVEFSLGFGPVVDKIVGIPTLSKTFERRHRALVAHFSDRNQRGR